MIKIKAVKIIAPGDADVLQLTEAEINQPSGDEVLIKVMAAGVNRPDVAQRKGNYPAPKGAPQDIPGLEVSGIIESCGKEVKRWKPGDQVCALLPGGGYASYTTVHEDMCMQKPSSLSFTEAAALPETVLTVWHNVFQRGHLKEGENFLVHGGSSGIGTTAIQLAKALGANVFTTAGSSEKCKACDELNANICINYKKEDFEPILKDKGVDVILDMIGGEYFQKNINLLKEEGRLVHINAMKGAKVELNIMKIMLKRLTITGSTLRSREIPFKANLAREVEKHVWPLIERKKFTPVIYKTFPLEKAADAHRLMEESSHIGKIILTLNSKE